LPSKAFSRQNSLFFPPKLLHQMQGTQNNHVVIDEVALLFCVDLDLTRESNWHIVFEGDKVQIGNSGRGGKTVLLTDVEYHEANTLKEASECMARYAPNARLMAGGTDLLVDLKSGRYRTNHVVFLNRIASLHGLTTTNGSLRIGALTTPNQLWASTTIWERFPAILDAVRDMAVLQIRNMATVGGNIAVGVPSSDLPPILIVLKASVILWSLSGEREVPLEDFFVGPRQTVRRDDEILTEIRLPYPPARFGAAYAPLALREANGCSVASVAASLLLDEKGIIRDARVCIGAVAPIPMLVKTAKAALVGKAADKAAFRRAADEATKVSHPISDIRGSANYRRELVSVLTRRALETARERALGGQQ
jgi:carbon-monoxide dehydrogenase medium subunit